MNRLTLLAYAAVVLSGLSAAFAGDSPGTLTIVGPQPATPYYHLLAQQAASDKQPMRVDRVAVNGKEVRQFAIRNGPSENFDNRITPTGDLTIIARYAWKPGEKLTFEIAGEDEAKKPQRLTWSATAPGTVGAAWDSHWPYYVSVILRERGGLDRHAEPVHVSLSVFADQVTDPKREVRVIQVSADGLKEIPSQVDGMSTWNRKDLIDKKEVDPKTGQPITRYHATTTFNVAFTADVPAHGERVYLVFYGNPDAPTPNYRADLSAKGEGVGLTIENASYRIGLDKRSGHIETIFLKQGVNLLFEHKLETNGAVHWNPDCYSPPGPWVHASDWDPPTESRTLAGPVFIRTERRSLLPHMKEVSSTVSYTFYADQPYVMVTTLTEILEDIDVQALRNSEIVFNHAVFDEFAWRDPSSGKPRTLPLDETAKHPLHAVHIEPDVGWLAFLSRKQACAFGGIPLEVTAIDRPGRQPMTQQPYIYVNNGPWIYWSRGLVYPFGSNNFTRMVRVPAGGVYFERTAYLPFPLGKGDLFEKIESTGARLRDPLDVEVVMDTDPRTPKQWVAPILTAPFDEGVKGSVGGKKE